MSTQTEGGARPDRKQAPDRSVSDVAREAFRTRVIEGDGADRNRSKDSGPSSG